MGKRLNTRLIKGNYSYTTEQIADLFAVDIATVRRWIRKEGLRRIPNAYPHLIHSSDLLAFSEEQKKKQRHSCAIDEVFCFRCRKPRAAALGSATITHLPNTSIRFQAKCSECGGKMNRTIRGAEWSKNHSLARYLGEAAEEHNEVRLPPLKCALYGEENNA